MLKNSYIHIPKVGYITEKKIWSAGVKDWSDFDKVKLPSFRKKHIKKFVDLSIENLKNGNYSFAHLIYNEAQQQRKYSKISMIQSLLELQIQLRYL